MKKLIIILLSLFYIIHLFAGDFIELYFKNGAYIYYEADSYWTKWYRKHDYFCYFFNVEDKAIPNTDYLCLCDYCAMNPVSRETKRQDYKNLRDKIQASSNKANYFENNGVISDDWCVSVRYDQLHSVRRTKPEPSAQELIYFEGEKK